MPSDVLQAGSKPSAEAHSVRGASFGVTTWLVATNCVTFLLIRIADKLWPSANPVHWGFDWGPLSLGAQPWRLLTSIFVHLSVLHLLQNLLFLWVFGKRVEQILGKWIFLFVYLSCGLAGSILSVAIRPEIAQGGASGGILGLAGVLITVYGLKFAQLSASARWKLAMLILLTAYNLWPDVALPVASHLAHAGGLVSGLVLGALLTSDVAVKKRRRSWIFSAVTLILLVGFLSARYFNTYILHLGSAFRLSENGETDNALKEVQAALSTKPASVLGNIMAAQVYLRKEDYAKVEVFARRALSREAENDHAKYLLGVAELHTGHCNEAHDIAQDLIARNFRNSEAWALNQAECDFIGLGDRYLSDGKPIIAIVYYRKALETKPNDYRARIGIAKSYQAQGELKKAAAAAAEAEQIRREAHQ